MHCFPRFLNRSQDWYFQIPVFSLQLKQRLYYAAPSLFPAIKEWKSQIGPSFTVCLLTFMQPSKPLTQLADTLMQLLFQNPLPHRVGFPNFKPSIINPTHSDVQGKRIYI